MPLKTNTRCRSGTWTRAPSRSWGSSGNLKSRATIGNACRTRCGPCSPDGCSRESQHVGHERHEAYFFAERFEAPFFAAFAGLCRLAALAFGIVVFVSFVLVFSAVVAVIDSARSMIFLNI